MRPLPIEILHPELGKSLPLPQRMSEHAAGYDLAAALDTPALIAPGERLAIPLGFAMAVPEGYEAQIRPRSGLALRHGITLLNTPGTIDADYRGQVHAIVVNHGSEPFEVQPGMRIAQMVIVAVSTPAIEVVMSLRETVRGSGGFGSTGR